jgi:succinate dehydrogenase / fumarate reductase, cytochrome b subunit
MSSSPTLRTPRVYRRGAWSRFTEGLRYGGGVGQWSWLIHRVTGLGILAFLVIHIIDTFLVVAWPELYDHTIDIYGGVVSGLPEGWGINGYYWFLRWAFRAGELALIACVLFHSVNGVRIVLFDFWPKSADHQRQVFWVALGVFVAIMLPVTWVVLSALAAPPGHVTH